MSKWCVGFLVSSSLIAHNWQQTCVALAAAKRQSIIQTILVYTFDRIVDENDDEDCSDEDFDGSASTAQKSPKNIEKLIDETCVEVKFDDF